MDSGKYIYQDGCYYVVRNANYEPKVKKFNTTKFASVEDAYEAARTWRDEQEQLIAERKASQLTIFKQSQAEKDKAWEEAKQAREELEKLKSQQETERYFRELEESRSNCKKNAYEQWIEKNQILYCTKIAKEALNNLIISQHAGSTTPITLDLIEKEVAIQLAVAEEFKNFKTKEQMLTYMFGDNRLTYS